MMTGPSPDVPETAASFQGATAEKMREITIKTYDIRDIPHRDRHCPVKLDELQFLIHSQASLHRTKAVHNLRLLKKLLESRGSTLRGFVLYAENIGPVAYSVYYPMINEKGFRRAYCEDFFITESFRNYGVSKILFHRLAKHVIDAGAGELQWSTDKRNYPVHAFVKEKLGATHPNIITISATSLLDPKSPLTASLTHQWNEKDFITRPLNSEDVNLPELLGLHPDMVRNTGDLSFIGFVTFEKRKSRPIAITPGWIHTSTFQLKHGLHLEPPVFAPDADKEKIIYSVIAASRKYAAANQLPYFRWHINEKDPDMTNLLQNKLKLPKDSMLGTPESELVVYHLKNGALKQLAAEEPEQVIWIPASAPIGTPKERSYSNTDPNKSIS